MWGRSVYHSLVSLCSLCSDNTRERALLVVAIEGEEAPGKERKQEEEEEEEEEEQQQKEEEEEEEEEKKKKKWDWEVK